MIVLIVCSVLPLGSLNQPVIRLLGRLFSEDKQNKATDLPLLQIRVSLESTAELVLFRKIRI